MKTGKKSKLSIEVIIAAVLMFIVLGIGSGTGSHVDGASTNSLEAKRITSSSSTITTKKKTTPDPNDITAVRITGYDSVMVARDTYQSSSGSTSSSTTGVLHSMRTAYVAQVYPKLTNNYYCMNMGLGITDDIWYLVREYQVINGVNHLMFADTVTQQYITTNTTHYSNGTSTSSYIITYKNIGDGLSGPNGQGISDMLNMRYNQISYIFSEAVKANAGGAAVIPRYQQNGVYNVMDHRKDGFCIAIWYLSGTTTATLQSQNVWTNTPGLQGQTAQLLANADAYANFVNAGYINKAPTWGKDQAYYVNDNLIGPFTLTYNHTTGTSVFGGARILWTNNRYNSKWRSSTKNIL